MLGQDPVAMIRVLTPHDLQILPSRPTPAEQKMRTGEAVEMHREQDLDDDEDQEEDETGEECTSSDSDSVAQIPLEAASHSNEERHAESSEALELPAAVGRVRNVSAAEAIIIRSEEMPAVHPLISINSSCKAKKRLSLQFSSTHPANETTGGGMRRKPSQGILQDEQSVAGELASSQMKTNLSLNDLPTREGKDKDKIVRKLERIPRGKCVRDCRVCCARRRRALIRSLFLSLSLSPWPFSLQQIGEPARDPRDQSHLQTDETKAESRPCLEGGG